MSPLSFPIVTKPGQYGQLLDQVRNHCRVRHLALSTEKQYVQWIRRFILFHNKRHPLEMGKAEVSAFLTHLAVEEHVSASTQNQALAALLFLYRNVKHNLPVRSPRLCRVCGLLALDQENALT